VDLFLHWLWVLLYFFCGLWICFCVCDFEFVMAGGGFSNFC
jgi:hypothetical protein